MAREEEEHGQTTPRPSFHSAMMSPHPAVRRFLASLPGKEAYACDLHKVSLARMRSMEDKVEEGGENYAAKRPQQRRICFSIKEKKMEDKVEEPNKGSYIRRVWTDVDFEIGLLNGIIDYNTRNGRYPFCHSCCFDDFIANWLQVDVPKHGLIDVVRKLREKYLTNMVRDGATVDFADPRDQIAFNLAHKIWGTAQSREEDWKPLKFEG